MCSSYDKNTATAVHTGSTWLWGSHAWSISSQSVTKGKAFIFSKLKVIYRFRQQVIDACAFRVYGHWVKKGEGQNRAALFENQAKTELVNMYIRGLNHWDQDSKLKPLCSEWMKISSKFNEFLDRTRRSTNLLLKSQNLCFH